MLGAADRARRELGFVAWPAQRAEVQRLRERLGDEPALDGGRRARRPVAWLRRGRGPRDRPERGWESLTPTELEVARQAAAGLTNPQIAERLFVSRATVKTHLSHVYAKLDLSEPRAARAADIGHLADVVGPGLPYGRSRAHGQRRSTYTEVDMKQFHRIAGVAVVLAAALATAPAALAIPPVDDDGPTIPHCPKGYVMVDEVCVKIPPPPPPPPSNSPLLTLETPRQTTDQAAVRVAGRATDADQPATALTVRITIDGVLKRTLTANLPDEPVATPGVAKVIPPPVGPARPPLQRHDPRRGGREPGVRDGGQRRQHRL